MKLLYQQGKTITQSESVTLDIVRACAALGVFLSHWAMMTHNGLSYLESLGRPGVLVFFVLSGCLIASASEKGTLQKYVIARVARLYSVTIPILILLVLLILITSHLCPGIFKPALTPSQLILQAVSSLTFTNRWWFAMVPAFYDGPFWSLSYEAGFYIVWGAFVFGGRLRWMWTAAASALVGPKILILFPIWLLGAIAYRSGLRLTALGSIIALPIIAVLLVAGRQYPVLPDAWWGESSIFLSDWLRGVAFLLLIWSALTWLRFKKLGIATWIANRSFTLYLLHFPLLGILSYRFTSASPSMPLESTGVGVVALALCFAIGSYIEPTTKWWRSALGKIWSPRL